MSKVRYVSTPFVEVGDEFRGRRPLRPLAPEDPHALALHGREFRRRGVEAPDAVLRDAADQPVLVGADDRAAVRVELAALLCPIVRVGVEVDELEGSPAARVVQREQAGIGHGVVSAEHDGEEAGHDRAAAGARRCAAWRSSGGCVGPSVDVAAVDEPHAAEHARAPWRGRARRRGTAPPRSGRPRRSRRRAGRAVRSARRCATSCASSKGMPRTATSPSAAVGRSMCGALRKVAMPANGISPLPIYFTPLPYRCETSAMDSSTRSQPRENSSGGWLRAGVGRNQLYAGS